MIRRILAPLDGSAHAESALASAIALASAFDAEIIVQRVVESGGGGSSFNDGMHWRFLRAEALAYLSEIKTRCAGKCRSCEIAVSQGDPAEEILQCSGDRDADLIVLSTHGRGHRGPFRLGNTVQQIVFAANVSVMLVPAEAREEPGLEKQAFRRILVPLDGSRRAEWALCLASTIAEAHASTLHMVHVVPVPEMARRFPRTPAEEKLRQQVVQHNRKAAREYLDAMEARFEGGRLQVRSHLLVSSRVAQTIEKVAEEQQADLLVSCAHGHGGEGEWLYGGIAGSLIAHTKVPLLLFQDLAYEATNTESCAEPGEERLMEQAP
jgi:nucleotide-binding universal stress UspA family protein